MKKYYQVNFFTKPEVLDEYGGWITQYAREVLHSILSMDKRKLREEFEKIPKEEIEAFYKSSIRTKIYVNEAIHDKWIALPYRFKKHAQYLITQKLLEKLKEGVIWESSL